MSFIISLINAIKSLAKKGISIKKRVKKAIRSAIIGYVLPAFIIVVLIASAFYSVTGAVSDMFNKIAEKFGSSSIPDSEFYDGLSESDIEQLIDETGATLNPKKVAKYMKIESESVPKAIEGTKITNVSDGKSVDTTKENIQINTQKYYDLYKLKWEFIAAIDLATFSADDINKLTAINEASIIKPVFTWEENLSKDTTNYWKEWTVVEEHDSSTNETKEIKNTKSDAKEQYKQVQEPLAIPSKVSTMFGDYIYTINKDVVTEDTGYCTPYVENETVTTREEFWKEVDDLSKPIYNNDYTKPIIEKKPVYTTPTKFTEYGYTFVKSKRTAYMSNNYGYQVIYTEPNIMSSAKDRVYPSDTLEVVGYSDDWIKVKYGNKTGYTRKCWFYVSSEEIIGYNETIVGYEKKIVGYEKKKLYKTITTTTKTMKQTKTTVIEDKVGSVKQNFDPSKFIEYINANNLSVKDLELVREILDSIPSGNILTDNIDRIIEGEYGDTSNSSSNNGVNNSGGSGNVGSMAGVLPLYLQWDERWGNLPYAGNTIGKAGCGPTTMAMVVTGLMGNLAPFDTNNDGVADPGEMANWSTKNGHACNGGGSYNTLISSAASAAGLSCKETYDFNEVYNALQNGKVVVYNVAPNTLLPSGHHFLVLTGVDSEGKIKLNDPNSNVNQTKSFEVKDIRDIAKVYWIIDNECLTREQKFIMKVRQGAMEGQKEFGVFASVTIAQAILESGWGESQLSVKANNLFGVKADSSWTGPTIDMLTQEEVNGGKVTVTAKWRVYDSWGDSIYDHGKFLKENSRYTEAGVFNATNCYDQIRAIHRAGYATDSSYTDLVTGIIDSYKLYLYDEMANN